MTETNSQELIVSSPAGTSSSPFLLNNQDFPVYFLLQVITVILTLAVTIIVISNSVHLNEIRNLLEIDPICKKQITNVF